MGILTHYFDDKNSPGAALAIITDGRPPHIECIGLANIEQETPITPETAFELASATKIFTATGLMLLVERNRLDLAAPVQEYLSEFENNKAVRPITIRDLLQHTSGLTDYLESGMYTPTECMTKEYIMRQLPQWAEEAVPGQEYSYSNTNYVVLARVVEAVMEISFADFIEVNLLKPFSLHSTTASFDLASPSEIASGYQNLGYGLPQIEASMELMIDTDGDGGIYSTLGDLIQWQSLFWDGEIVNDESLHLMQTPGQLDTGKSFPYGLGLQVEQREDGEVWCGHGGSWTNTTTLIGRYLKEKTTIIVLSNEFMAPVERISQRAYQLYTSGEIGG